MPAAVRLGDPISCGDTMIEGSGDVFVNGIPVCRVRRDKTAGHCFLPTTISSGGPENVLVNGSPIVRVGDPIIPHTCPPPPVTHGGAAATGSPDVFANDE